MLDQKPFNINSEQFQLKVDKLKSFGMLLEDLITNHLKNLSPADKDYNKKCLELCHVGKFLVLLDKGFTISNVSEKPDFIISNGKTVIGLEHCIIVQSEFKKQEGSTKDLFEKVKIVYLQKYPESKFIANIWLKKNNFIFKKTDHNRIIEQLVKVISTFVQTSKLLENNLIDSISTSFHTDLAFVPNFGAWVQMYLTNQDLISTIKRKEKLLQSYKSKLELNEQWLLMVIGGVGNSSLRVKKDFEFKTESMFNRVFLMEDFDANIYQIK